ncbi:hypothetical protein L211DRAFT_850182 [Terfezia boudieri ATCC MYA-4762]|uniref:Uncharacterized protein n=1 Tax=Terfezia boudieri ATCC MYA-4762 TaxID=1051890 RepID=A0A3N4LNR8_9PEZI|nr:hypothetical protein L211DRAFT_850182 [Terfezia boudieri ATCC MYA-4762]
MHHISTVLILFHTFITLQLLCPTTASPISKRFIPVILPTTISNSLFHPLLDPPPQLSNTDFGSNSPPEYCKDICGVKKRALPSKTPTVVTVSGRWITETQDSNHSTPETSTDTPKDQPTQTILDFDSQKVHDVNTGTIQGVSPSDSCDCASLKLVNDIKSYLLKEIAKQIPTTTTTSTTSTSTTSTTTPHPTQTNPKIPSDDLTPGKLSAIAVGSCFLLFVLPLFGFIIYSITKSKQVAKEKDQRRPSSCLSIDSLNPDVGEMRNNILSFLGTGDATAVSESQEIIVAGVGELGRYEVVVEVEEMGLQDEVRVSQVGLAR